MKNSSIWRDIARRLECRWRERTRKLRRATEEPQHPADARDNDLAEDIDNAAMQEVTPDDIRFYCGGVPTPAQNGGRMVI